MKLLQYVRRLRFLILASIALTPVAIAQTPPTPVWARLVPQESQTVSVGLPAGSTYRLGTSVCPANGGGPAWSPSIFVPAAVTLGPIYWPSGIFPFADPCSGTPKELDILEIAAQQTVTTVDTSTTPATTGSFTVAGLAPPSSLPFAPGIAYIFTISNLTPTQFTLSMANALGGSVLFLCLTPQDISPTGLAVSCAVPAIPATQ